MTTPRPRSVLVIDDDEDLRRSMVTYFEDNGFIVHQAAGGRQGLELFNQIRPDLVFTDLMMPEVDGLAVVVGIARKSPETPVVVVSGNGSVGYAIETVRAGAWDYITKPILDFVELDRVIDRVMARVEALKAEVPPHITLRNAALAHDFKNILTGIVGNLSIARLDLGQEHPAAKALERAEQASLRAGALASRLVDSGRESDACAGISVKDALAECIALAGVTQPWQVELVVDPDTGAVAMEAGEFSQVIMNFLLNAVQSMTSGGKVKVEARPLHLGEENPFHLSGGDYASITVADTGCGMSEEVMAYLFTPYFTTKPHGTGLGMVSARTIIEVSKGAISIESASGVGTRITVLLPKAP